MLAVILVLCLFLPVVYLIYRISTYNFNYWKHQNVPYLKPTPLFGNYADYILMKKHSGIVAQNICLVFPDAPYIGTFYGTEPALLVQSPELIKLILTKDFFYFSGREVSEYSHKEVLTQSMFFTYGDRWKVIRQNSSQSFSSSKMKIMFPLLAKCGYTFENLLDSVSKNHVVDVRSLMARFTMDCIASCIFGVESNVMNEEKNNPFVTVGGTVFEQSNLRGFLQIVRAIWPAIFYGLRLKIFPLALDHFFKNLLTDVFEARNNEASGRHDFVDLLLEYKKQRYLSGDSITNMKIDTGKMSSLKVDDNLLSSLSTAYFAAGYETSAVTLDLTLYELAKYPEVQELAFEEVDAYLRRHKNQLDYSCITELPYLNACMHETFRLYPALALLTREVMEDYTLPSGLLLKKGMRIHVPVYHLHHSPEYFPEPEKFHPERFLPDSKHNHTTYTYLPFGEGPRICIGRRLALMIVCSGLVTVLKKYRLTLAEGTPRTLDCDPRTIVTQPRGPLNVNFLPREGWEQRLFSHQND